MKTDFVAIRNLLKELPGANLEAQAQALAHQDTLTKPQGSLGRLEEIAAFLAAWQKNHPPRMQNPHCLVFAGNHGVAALGVSAFPPEVTVQMVANFQNGGAAINQLCQSFGTKLSVIALELDKPTQDFTQAAAMSEEECAAAFFTGYNAVPIDADVLALGEMGIANTTPASAICLALLGETAAFWTGPGTGVAGPALANKIKVVEDGIKFHQAHLSDPLEAMRRLGGRELAAIAGAIVKARYQNIPVLLDGFITTASALPLFALNPQALDHCLVAHASAEPGHQKILTKINKIPLLNLNLRLGEASGAALAVPILQAATNCHNQMASFSQAAVSNKV